VSLVLDVALSQGIITKQQHARAAQVDRNRQLGVAKSKLTRERKSWAMKFFRKECTWGEYMAGVLDVDSRLAQLK
jgi:hypothetical protein